MKKLIQLVRIDNILMVALTQLLMYYAVISPILNALDLVSATSTLSLVLTVLGTSCITMAGYVINDYFDTRIDEINKPQKVLIGKAVSRHAAMQLHQILTSIGVLCGLLVAWQARSITIAMIFIFVPGLLWFYSTAYKRLFLVGNLVIAGITAFVPLTVVMVESAFLSQQYGSIVFETGVIADLYRWVGLFALFAFAMTLLRELVKDIEDEKGDREMECNTVPIVLGQQWTKALIATLAACIIGAIVYLTYTHLTFAESGLMKSYLLYGVSAPLLFFITLIFRAKNASDYRTSQKILKAIMLIGVLFSLAFAHTL